MSSDLAALLMLAVPLAGAAIVPLLNFFCSRYVPVIAVLLGLISALAAFYLPSGAGGSVLVFDWLPGVLKTGFLVDGLSLVPALIARRRG